MDRRNSNSNPDDDRTPSQPANPNVFDDEYALDLDEDDFMPAVSDGFRPAGMGGNQGWNGDRQGHDRNDSPRPPFVPAHSADNDLRRLASRNSTMKAPGVQESTSHDLRDPGTHHSQGPSSQATAALQHRASISSTGSFATMARSESPFGTEPSHPYGMYPQNTMARSASVTTSSTQRQPHRSVSLQRPTHPYGMYIQNVDEEEPPMPTVQTAIPVGFPGLNTGYHRRLGPDGEEQDIIGPDGHTEQLPPYSRYPEEGPVKAAMAAEASSTPIETPVAAPSDASNEAILPIVPSPPVSPATPSPPQQQEVQRTESPPTGRPQTVAALSTTEHGASEKQEIGKSAKSWRSKKLLGRVPMGVALILLVLVLIFAIVLGAAIGTFVAKNREKEDRRMRDKDAEPQVTGPSRSLFDATPIPTPSSLVPLATGEFALPLGIAQESSPSCLIQANQLSAWSCKMTFAPLLLKISGTGRRASQFMAQLVADTKPDGGVQYGLQPPAIGIQPMQLVLDLDYKALGPAYHFSTMYDKLVVLNPEEFAAGASLQQAAFRKRDDKPPFRHRFQVLPGDNPWFCYWNGTYLEGYLYANDNSSAASMTAYPTSWPSDVYGSSIPIEPAAPATAVDSASPPVAEITPMPPVRRRGDDGYIRKVPYPRIVKIEERRIPGSPQPYCQKMLLLDNGLPVEAVDDAGNPIKVALQEDDPDLDEFFGPPAPTSSSSSSSPNTTERRRAEADKRSDPPGGCHCQWMFQ